MPGTTAGSGLGQFACHCLNIRIRPGRSNQVATDPPAEDPAFSQVFVDEDGISIAHTQVTVRTRTRGVPIAGTSRLSRYTTVTCLLCGLVVYRVYQAYSPEIEGKDGPLLPTEDWVERDILKSVNGWIEVYRDCLSGDAVEQAASSTNFSETFNLLLLPKDSPRSSPEPIFQRPPSRSSSGSPPPPPPKFFSNMQPVFLPPPFTPSHPVFAYLSSFAVKESQAVRDAAEEHLTEQMKLKTSEIENTDVELRRKVDTLWTRFRDSVSRIQEETGHPNGRRGFSSGSRERAAVNGLELTSGTPSAVRNFIPSSVSRPRSSSPPAPRVSALSASLATSSFHHPRARSTATSPPPSHNRSLSIMSNGSSHSASTMGSSSIAVPQSVDNVLQMRRNINDDIDTATSYRYFVTLEADSARERGRKPLPDRGPTQADGATNASANTVVISDDAQKQPAEQTSPSRANKGKRKVTFDVKPAVVTIKRELASEQREEEERRVDADMIFDLEDLDGGEAGSPGKPQPTLQLVEQPTAPVRPRRQRPHNVDNLSTSFSGLRPTSLPTPSHIRPSRNGSDVSVPTMMLSLPKPSIPPRMQVEVSSSTGGNTSAESSDGYKTPPPDPKMLKLLAADMPSHRGAWKPDSKAWQTFARRQPGHPDTEPIIEEGEDDVIIDASGFAVPDVLPKNMRQSGNDVFVGSLPISMKLPKQREKLSLASYQPETLAKLASPTTQKKQSTTSIRKAVYAERDRSRTLDPGPLDFASVIDEDEEEEEDLGEEGELVPDDSFTGGRSRRAAFKILKARSEVPDSGMWRSLA